MIESLLYSFPRAHETMGSCNLRCRALGYQFLAAKDCGKATFDRAQKNHRARVWFALSACSAWKTDT